MKQNRNYDPKVFTVSKERKEIALLPNIGRFCECGCNKRLEGKRITRRIHGKKITYFMKIQKDQKFFSKYCRERSFRQNNKDRKKLSLTCRLQLKPKSDSKPYRVLAIYLRQGLKREYKIKEGSDLWNFIEKFTNNLNEGKP